MEQIPPCNLYFESKIMCFNYCNQGAVTGVVWRTSMRNLQIVLLSMSCPRGHHYTAILCTYFVGCIHSIMWCAVHMHPKYWLQRWAKYFKPFQYLTNKSRKSSLLTGWKNDPNFCCWGYRGCLNVSPVPLHEWFFEIGEMHGLTVFFDVDMSQNKLRVFVSFIAIVSARWKPVNMRSTKQSVWDHQSKNPIIQWKKKNIYIPGIIT